MKIAILTSTISEAEFFPNIIELKKLGKKRGHKVDIFKNGEFSLLIDKGKTDIYYNNLKFDPKNYDVAINRISTREKSNADYYIIEEFIKAKVPLFNTPEAIAKSSNKLLSLQIISELNLQLTKSLVVRRSENLDYTTKYFNFPLIVKRIFGSLGSSVLICYDEKQLKSTFDYIWNMNRNEVLLIQDFIKSEDSTISDYRAFALGEKIIASMKRTNYNNDFRANYKKGASVKYAPLTDLEKHQVLMITKKFGLEIAGVDFIRTQNGPVFLEVNSNPGLEGIRLATQEKKYDILDSILDYCETKYQS